MIYKESMHLWSVFGRKGWQKVTAVTSNTLKVTHLTHLTYFLENSQWTITLWENGQIYARYLNFSAIL